VTPADLAAKLVDERLIRIHVQYLADDAMEGRGTATHGGAAAAAYTAAQFRRLGLVPAGDSGSYQERVPLISRLVTSADLRLVNQPNGILRFKEQFVLWSESQDTLTAFEGDAVFVGYGIVAPGYQWDDYKGVNVQGKIVLALAGDPDSTRFDRHTGMTYGTWRYKLDEAAKHGARAVLLIHSARTVAFPWSNTLAFTRDLTALDRPVSSVVAGGWLSEPAATALLQQADANLSDLIEAAGTPAFQPRAIGLRFSGTVGTAIRHWETHNVVARLPGKGPRSSQVFVIGAHYDHLGIGLPINGDSVYNGAEDNASGVACVLAAAEAIVRSRVAPLRSIIFVAFGAEERGLIGSQAFVAHPPVPRASLVGMVNMDVMNLWGRTTDIGTVGPDHNSLGQTLRDATAAEHMHVTVDPDDVRRGRFYRSDQFSFMQAGIPAIRLISGLEFEGRPPDWGRQQKDEMWAHRYHTPGDEMLPWYSTDGTAQQTRVLVRLALAAANDPAAPAWAKSSPFRPVVEMK
jgi:hypothetical protein